MFKYSLQSNAAMLKGPGMVKHQILNVTVNCDVWLKTTRSSLLLKKFNVSHAVHLKRFCIE